MFFVFVPVSSCSTVRRLHEPGQVHNFGTNGKVALTADPHKQMGPRPNQSTWTLLTQALTTPVYHFGDPHNKDYNILGSILGHLYFGKLPYSKIHQAPGVNLGTFRAKGLG